MTSSVIGSKSTAIVRAFLATPGLIAIALFFVAPLIFVGAEAFVEGGQGFFKLSQSREFWSGLLNSIVLGLIAAAISVGVGLIVAQRIARMDRRARMAWQFLIALPLTFSGLIVAYGFILAFGRAGFVTLTFEATLGINPVSFSQMVYSPYGLAFVYSYYLIPRVVMILTPVLVNFDSSQLAAAESMGAHRFETLIDILLPQIRPALVSSFAIVAAVAIGAYGTALALVGTQVNILPLQLYAMVSDAGSDFAVTAALGMTLMALCTSVMAIGEWQSSARTRS